jgi:hypothetical protein
MSNGNAAALSYLAAGAANQILVGAGVTTIPVWTSTSANVITMLGSANNAAILSNIGALSSASISDTAYDATSWDGVTTIAPSKNAIRDYLESRMPTGADGSYRLVVTNNTAISPTASVDELYPEANVWKANQNGTEYSMAIGPTGGQVTFAGPSVPRIVTLPDAAFSAARIDAGQTFTGHNTFEGVTATGATGTGNMVFDGTPTLVTPVIGAATGTSLMATGRVDGTVGMFLPAANAALTISVATHGNSAYFMNTGDSDAHSIYTLPVAVAGIQYCIANYTGISTKIKFQTSGAGQYIDLDGTLTGSGKGVKFAGAAGDKGCVVGVDATHWIFYTGKGAPAIDNT